MLLSKAGAERKLATPLPSLRYIPLLKVKLTDIICLLPVFFILVFSYLCDEHRAYQLENIPNFDLLLY